MALTYGSYLKIPELLSLQQRVSPGPEHDEMLFIVIHQVYELWFRQEIHETEQLIRSFSAGDGPASSATLRRILTILKTMVAQIDVLETMTPVSFRSFRGFLESASGFQSCQFREWEFLLGAKRPAPLRNYPEGSPERTTLERRLREPTLWDGYLRFLAHHGPTHGYSIPAATLGRDVSQPIEPSRELQDTLVGIYRDHAGLRAMSETLVDLDEGLQEWRYRHVKMVERTIGNLPGTGGSPGAEYLKATLFRPLFPDLWEIRSRL